MNFKICDTILLNGFIETVPYYLYFSHIQLLLELYMAITIVEVVMMHQRYPKKLYIFICKFNIYLISQKLDNFHEISSPTPPTIFH